MPKIVYRNDLLGWFCAACFKQRKRPEMYHPDEVELDSLLKEDEILILLGSGFNPMPYLDRIFLLFWFDTPEVIGDNKPRDREWRFHAVSDDKLAEVSFKTAFPSAKVPEHAYFLHKEHPFKYAAMRYFNDPRESITEWNRLIHYSQRDKEFFDTLTSKDGKIIQDYERKRHLHYG